MPMRVISLCARPLRRLLRLSAGSFYRTTPSTLKPGMNTADRPEMERSGPKNLSGPTVQPVDEPTAAVPRRKNGTTFYHSLASGASVTAIAT
jgi:hypothetical protein